MSATRAARGVDRVPVRTIAMAIGMVLATTIGLLLLYEARRTLVWMVVAAFFTVSLYPIVSWVQRRLKCPRSVATLLVFFIVIIVMAALGAAFAVPLAREGTAFAGQLPQQLQDARAGRGPVGDLLERTNALQYVQDNEDKVRAFATGLTTPATGILKGVATGLAGVVTIFVLAYLMVLEGPKMVDGTLSLMQPVRRERVRRVAADCAKSITGYISGNLMISAICGILTYITLKVTGVPFAGLISIFVALADLIPLVGATLGAVIACIAAVIHSLPALIAVAIFFVIYQQLENHLLQPLILSRTVKLNPLAVLVSILIAVELAGILGAFLAIPVAGIIQVIIRDLWDHRRGRLKEEPTVGEEQTSVTPPITPLRDESLAAPEGRRLTTGH